MDLPAIVRSQRRGQRRRLGHKLYNLSEGGNQSYNFFILFMIFNCIYIKFICFHKYILRRAGQLQKARALVSAKTTS